jgi:hypothetical protein
MLVLQAVLPEFVMAARAAVQASSAGSHAEHAAPGGPAPVGDERPGPGHRHDEDCPFCLARAIHPPLPPVHAAAPFVPAAAGRVVPVWSLPAVRARLVRTEARPRAPPPSGPIVLRSAGA